MGAMALRLPDLNDAIRVTMLEEFEAEEIQTPYGSRLMTIRGARALPDLLRMTLREGDDDTLGEVLSDPMFWIPTERTLDGASRAVNYKQAAKRIARVEFNTWYVRALSITLMREGAPKCQVVAASERAWDPECNTHHNALVEPSVVYAGHRARYWPSPRFGIFSIPSSPGCRHTIRRLP